MIVWYCRECGHSEEAAVDFEPGDENLCLPCFECDEGIMMPVPPKDWTVAKEKNNG